MKLGLRRYGASDSQDEALATLGRLFDIAEPGAVFSEPVKAGDNLFHTDKAQCMACHGPKGKGDGLDPDVTKRNKDVWGLPLRPADLTLGVYRGGRRPIDLYRRVHTGVKGGEMPGFGGQLRSEEIWNLVDYVQSLGLPMLETASR